MCVGIAVFHLVELIAESHSVFPYVQRFAYFTDFFFVFSGLMLGLSARSTGLAERDAARFYVLRLARIYPLHLASFAFFAAIGIAGMAGVLAVNMERFDFAFVPQQLLLVQSWGFGGSMTFNYVAWSLSAIWLMYVAFPLFVRMRSVWLLSVLVVAALAFGEALAAYAGAERITRLQVLDAGGLRALPSFAFGLMLAWFPPNWVGRRTTLSLLLVSAAVIFLWPATLHGTERLLVVYTACAAIVIAENLGVRTLLSWPVFTRFARYSFGVFLLHLCVGSVVKQAMPGAAAESFGLQMIFVAIGVAGTIVAAMASYRFIEQPAARWIGERRWVSERQAA